jgi:hypothetical protein
MEGPMETRSARDDATGTSSPGVFSYVIGGSESGSSARRMTAILEAESAEAAMRRVREIVGDDCEVGTAELGGQPGRHESAAPGPSRATR